MVIEGGDRRDYTQRKWTKSIDLYVEKAKRFPGSLWRTISEVGREDPKKIIHALKVGIALALVSLLYTLEPLFNGIGKNAIWAVMTVVVVFEFTAGATLCKGLNRGFGTLLAGSFAFFVHYLASETTDVFRAVFIGFTVFFVGAATTYTRFFPNIKKNYDYGLLIFLLTFNMILVSSYRVENVLNMVHQRLATILIGCGICLVMSLFVFPIWSGQDLHHHTINKLEGLAKSIEVCVNEYFKGDNSTILEESSEEDIYKGYKAVLDSKSRDETLALHASWEPRHTRDCNKFPSKQYVKLGAVLRHFAYSVVALHGCLQSEIQTPRSIRVMFQDPCIRLGQEVKKVLMEIADSIRNRRHSSSEILSDKLTQALQDLNTTLKSQPRLFLAPSNDPQPPENIATHLPTARTSPFLNQNQNQKRSVAGIGSLSLPIITQKSDEVVKPKKVLRSQMSRLIAITSLEFSEALPFAAFASLLVEIVAKLDSVIEEAEELATMGCFKEYESSDTHSIDVTRNRLSSHMEA